MKSILLFALLFANCSFAQDFPQDWIGEYKGEMLLGNANRANDTIPIDFEIKTVIEDSIWTYTMTFHSLKYGEMTKDYRIVAKTIGDKKNFLFDELNGIQMELTFMNGTFYGMYDVMESTFVSTMRFIGDQLFIELICSSRKNKLTTQTEQEDGQEPIVADSFKPLLHQSVLLSKQ